MPMSEMWDIYDNERHVTGEVRREDARKMLPGQYHLVVHLWVLSPDGRILVTRRDPQKDGYPNMWENSGGAALQGEDSLTAALRELREETGIIATSGEVWRVLSSFRGNALHDVYFAYSDSSVQLTLQPGETVDSRWVNPGEMEEMLEAGLFATPVHNRYRNMQNAILRALKAYQAGVCLREALPEDAEALQVLMREAFDYNPSLELVRENLIAVLPNPEHKVLVAECDGEVSGYIEGGGYNCLYMLPMKNILALGVHPKKQGQGIGRLLLSALEDWAAGDGCAGVRLVSGHNRKGAHAFYEKCGYTMRKEQKNYIKRWEDDHAKK